MMVSPQQASTNNCALSCTGLQLMHSVGFLLSGYDGGDGGDYSDMGSPEPANTSSCLRGSSPDVSGAATGHDSPPSGAAGHRHATLAGSAADGSRSGGLSEQAVQWLLDAGRGLGPVTRGAGWAGASHWRFRAEPDAAAAAKPKAARWGRQPRLQQRPEL